MLVVRSVVDGDGHSTDRVDGHLGHVLQHAVLEPQDPIGDVFEAVVVAHHEHAAALVVSQRSQQMRDLMADLRVEVRGRFVGEEQRRAVREGPGDRHTLLFSTRQLGGHEPESWPEPETLEQRACPGMGRFAGDTGEVAGKLHVLLGGQRAQEVEVLEHEPEVTGAESR